MKKIIAIVALATAFAFGAKAQTFSHGFMEGALRLGYTGVHGDDFNDVHRSGFNFGFNIYEISVKPYDTGRISLGADVEWNTYRLKNDYYYLVNEHRVAVVDEGSLNVKRSRLSVASFGFPLSFTQKFGSDFAVTAGISALLNLNGDVYTRYKDGKDRRTLSTEGIRTNRCSYDLHFALTYRGVGAYFAYRPMDILKDDYGPSFNSFSIGVVFDLRDDGSWKK